MACTELLPRSTGEPFDGMVAVCHVVLNRVKARALSVKEVVLQPWQFSWANSGARPAIKDYDALERCFSAVDTCLVQRDNGNTLDGADHYYADYIPEPSWVKSMTFTGKIGRHLFYRS